MDLQSYYNKIREIEQSISEPSAVVVSQETPDGGRAGVRSEVSRRLAAKMITDGAARLATSDERKDFEIQKAESKRKMDQRAAASRMQFTLVSPQEVKRPSGGSQKNAD